MRELRCGVGLKGAEDKVANAARFEGGGGLKVL